MEHSIVQKMQSALMKSVDTLAAAKLGTLWKMITIPVLVSQSSMILDVLHFKCHLIN